MRLAESYKGYRIKQYTKKEVPYGRTLSEYEVQTKDNEPEYDGVGTIEECRELVDGLIIDKKQEGTYNGKY
jgi:hypothetical protein